MESQTVKSSAHVIITVMPSLPSEINNSIVRLTYEVRETWIRDHTFGALVPPPHMAYICDLHDIPVSLRLQVVALVRWIEAYNPPTSPTISEPTDDINVILQAWQQHAQKAEGLGAQAVLETATVDGFISERDAWIAEHGSVSLQTAAERGYEIDRVYVQERAHHDLGLYFIVAGITGEIDIPRTAIPTAELVQAQIALSQVPYVKEHDLRVYVSANEQLVVPGYLDRYVLVHRPEDNIQNKLAVASANKATTKSKYGWSLTGDR